MLGKLGAFWNLFKQGQQVADPALWKNRQITSNMLGAVILAIVAVSKSMGYDLPVDNETAISIGGGIVAIWNVVLTLITSRKVGINADGGMKSITITDPAPAIPPMPPIEEHIGKTVEEIRQSAAEALSASMARRNSGLYDNADRPRNDR